MSAPHPKAQDDAGPLSWFGRKPAPERIHAERVVQLLKPESEVMLSVQTAHGQELLFPETPRADRLDPINEIAVLMRSLTWRQMIDLSEAWNTPAEILHKWAVGHGER